MPSGILEAFGRLPPTKRGAVIAHLAIRTNGYATAHGINISFRFPPLVMNREGFLVATAVRYADYWLQAKVLRIIAGVLGQDFEGAWEEAVRV